MIVASDNNVQIVVTNPKSMLSEYDFIVFIGHDLRKLRRCKVLVGASNTRARRINSISGEGLDVQVPREGVGKR